MGRWLAVRAIGFGLRRGLTVDDADRAMAMAFRHRDSAWRQNVISDALVRTARKIRA